MSEARPFGIFFCLNRICFVYFSTSAIFVPYSETKSFESAKKETHTRLCFDGYIRASLCEYLFLLP